MFPTSRLRLLRAALAAAVLLFLFLPGWASAFHGKDVSAEKIGGVLDLADQHGRRRTLAEFHGKAVLIFFGYTHCPDVCPATLYRMNEVAQLLGDDARRLQVLWVTVDPDRDTQELLAHYVPAFNPTFLGLRGTHEQTARVTDAFKVAFQILHYKGETLVDHSAFGYLMDPAGRTRDRIDYDMAAPQIAADVRAVLAGK